jgi:hypothetical protein
MTIRALVTAGALFLAGCAFWDGALGGGHVLNPFGILFLFLSGAAWFGWEAFGENSRAARAESDIPIIRLDSILIKGLGSLMKPAPRARQSSRS